MPSIEWNKNVWPERFAAHDSDKQVYGHQWGDPDVDERFIRIRKLFVTPYLNPNHVALQIGAAGGRFSKYLTGFRKVYLVELNDCYFPWLKKRFPGDHVVCVKTNGTDLPGVPPNSVNFVLSLGVFMHIDPPDIEAYFESVKAVMAPGATFVVHYADKTKHRSLIEPSHSYTTPDLMRALAKHHGFVVAEEDLICLQHSSIIRLTLS